MKDQEMFPHRFTVFTPTYNRAHTLERLYHSLQKQSFTDFEWLVIDDGSTDGTARLFDQWLKEPNPFRIRYHQKENGGKHTAINLGLEKAKGTLFFTADSDDFLTSDALYKADLWAKSLPADEKYCAVVGNWGYSEDETPNTLFKSKWIDATFLDRYPEVSDCPIDGERAYVFFTEIHRKYKYPEFKNENFMTEAVAWNRMAHDGYKMRVFNDIIYIYKFLPNGLTLSGSKIFIDNPRGYGLWLKEKAKYSSFSYMMKLKMIYAYYTSVKLQLTKKEIADNIGTCTSIVFLLSSIHVAKSLYDHLFKTPNI